MLPILPFAAGLITGAAALKLWRKASVPVDVRNRLENTQASLRESAVSGLSRIEHATASLREQIAGQPVETNTADPAMAGLSTKNPASPIDAPTGDRE